MTKFNGILHALRIPGAVAACLTIMAILGSWYMSYANDSAVTAETLKTHGGDIEELQETDKKIIAEQGEHKEILMEMRELWKLAYPKMYEKAKEKVAEILDEFNNDSKTEWSTDSIPPDST